MIDPTDNPVNADTTKEPLPDTLPNTEKNENSCTTTTSTNDKQSSVLDPLSTLSPKEAYFELLRVWVKQANIAYNAQACFPYYLMTNYPQLMSPGGPMSPFLGQPPLQFGAVAALGGLPPIPGFQNVPPPALQNQQIFQRFAINMFNRNRLRQDDMFDNQLRNEESNLNNIVLC